MDSRKDGLDSRKVRQEVMDLWRENYRDSDRYVNLVFDAYFDSDFVECAYDGGRLTAAVMAIPYRFGNAESGLPGAVLYCMKNARANDVAADMDVLLSRIESRLKEAGVAFITAIPRGVDDYDYFSRRGFVSAFYNTEQCYTSIHDFRREFVAEIESDTSSLREVKERYFDDIKVEMLENLSFADTALEREIIDFMLQMEHKMEEFTNYHTELNIGVLLRLTVIAGGRIYYSKATDGTVTGVVMARVSENEMEDSGRYFADKISRYKIYEYMVHTGGGRSLIIKNPGQNSETALWEPMYAATLPGASQVGAVGVMERVYTGEGRSKVYGMAKILDLYEILKFQAKTQRKLKYSILVTDHGEVCRYDAKKGEVFVRRVERAAALSEDSGEPTRAMDMDEVSRILFRRGGGEWIVNEALELPALNGVLSLLP